MYRESKRLSWLVLFFLVIFFFHYCYAFGNNCPNELVTAASNQCPSNLAEMSANCPHKSKYALVDVMTALQGWDYATCGNKYVMWSCGYVACTFTASCTTVGTYQAAECTDAPMKIKTTYVMAWFQLSTTCTPTATSDCQSCNNLPANAVYTGVADTISSCPFQCNAGYYLSGATCPPCQNGWFSAAGSSSCSACTNAVATAVYTSPGTNSDNCQWSCDVGRYLSTPTSCSACTNAPSTGYYTSKGTTSTNCQFACNAGYYLAGSCVICPIGQYSLGNVLSCSPCTNSPATGYYTSSGTTSTNCLIGCNIGYYLDTPTSCSACTNAETTGYCTSS